MPTQVITSTGAIRGSSYVYERRTTLVDVVSTTTELSLYDGSTAGAATGWSIAGGDLGTNRMYRLTLLGNYLFNNSGSDTLIIKVRFGNTTVWQNTVINAPGAQGANRHPVQIDLKLYNLGTTNSQNINGAFITEKEDASAPTTGEGLVLETGTIKGGVLRGTAAIDTTAATKFDVTAKWSASSANNSFRIYHALSELI